MLKAIIFDFDGVLVESVDIKGDAFVALYEGESADIQRKVRHYHDMHGGKSRYEKIKYYEEELLGRVATQDVIDAKAQAFSNIVEEKVANAGWVPGALEFIKAHHGKVSMFVASATPHNELIRIITERKIFPYFQEIYGTPGTKAEHIGLILSKNGLKADEAVMIGDAMSDYNGAKPNGVPFVGRVRPGLSSPFPEGTRIILDLTHLAEALHDR